MRTLKLTLAYDGTTYAGWQRQSCAPTIQGCLELAFGEIEGRTVAVVGAGRTDAGVHALGQVASVRLAHPIDPATLTRALNAKLPTDIRVLHVEEAPIDFHARYGARRKVYRYCLATGPVASPFHRLYAWHLLQRLRLREMRQAAAVLCGQHDFAAFHTAGGDVETGSTVRTIFDVAVTPSRSSDRLEVSSTEYVTVDVVGDGFLRHMVRIIVGTLVEVGLGRRAVLAVADALASRRRDHAGPTAPPHGLKLLCVEY